MRKFCMILVSSFLLLAMLMMPAGASGMQAVVWEAASAVPPVNVAGYPRLDILSNGTLILANSGTIRKSVNGGQTWVRKDVTQNSATTVVSSSGQTHTLVRENWQPFVLMDGTVMLSYRARTANYTTGEFYTSIRVMYSNDNAETFINEEILVENTASAFRGYWEPFIIQIDEDTLALYYANDLDGIVGGAQQNICYVTYDLETKTWNKTQRVAINGISRNSRDGMPVVTQLSDGSFAMVFEAFDYNRRSYNGVYGQSPFVISMSRSADGKSWSTPVPIAAPQNITAGDRCAAPYITTLGDGRIAVSYMCDEDYIGTPAEKAVYNCNMDVIVSKGVVTLNSGIVPTTGGVSSSFEKLADPIAQVSNGYQIWCCVEYLDGRLYAVCSSGTNDKSESSKLKFRRANLSLSALNSPDAVSEFLVSNGESSCENGRPLLALMRWAFGE